MKRLLSAVFAVSLLSGAVAVAHADDGHRDSRDGRDRDSHRWNDRRADNHRSDNGRDHRSDRHEWNRHESSRGGDWNRHDDRSRGHSYAWRDTPRRYHADAYRWPSGYRHDGWSRGDRLPVAYRAPHYVVYDYGRYGLYAPPYGCRWVRVGDDVLLTAITTGVVVNVVNDLFY
jgi:Ni/Co efflux regulator RcnB